MRPRERKGLLLALCEWQAFSRLQRREKMAKQETVLKMFLFQNRHAVAKHLLHLEIQEVINQIDKQVDPDPEEWIDSAHWEEWEGFWEWWRD
jgi:hypothetical protein